MFAISILLALSIGLATAAQSATNSALAQTVGQIESAFFSNLGGTLIMVVVCLLVGHGDVTRALGCPAWQLLGGIYSIIYLIAAATCTPVLGVALTMAINMLGQIVMGSVVDGLGLLGTDPIAMSLPRLAGIIMTAIGIVLVYRGSAGEKGQGKVAANKLPYVAFALVAGGFAAMQSPTNAALAKSVGTVEASTISLGIGLLASVVLVLALTKTGFVSPRGARPWHLTGGVYGAFGVTSSAVAVPWLGAGLLMAGLMLGQLTGGMALDTLGAMGVSRRPAGAWRIAGALCLAAGIALVAAAKAMA